MNGYWLRLYTDLLNNRKVQNLPPELFKGWINLLCLAKEHGGVLPEIEDIAFRLRLADSEAMKLIEALHKANLIDETGGGLTPHNWAERQYETEETASNSQKGHFGNHKRWHVARGIIADDCPHCRPDVAQNRPANRGDVAPTSPGESSRGRAEADSEAETDSEAEQSRGFAEGETGRRGDGAKPAAAANDFNESHLSVFSFEGVEAYVIATKPHARNPGGLARKIWRDGTEDPRIEQWFKSKETGKETGNGAEPKKEFCGLGGCIDGYISVKMPNGYTAARKCPCIQEAAEGAA